MLERNIRGKQQQQKNYNGEQITTGSQNLA